MKTPIVSSSWPAHALARVGFAGLGIMGRAMVPHVVRAGFQLRAWNRSLSVFDRDDCHALDRTQSLAELGEHSDVLIVMVSDAAACDDVLFGDDGQSGASAGLRRGSIVVVMSSIPVARARQQAARLARQGVDYIDAPVSGGERGAVTGELTIMAGGKPEVIARAAPVLQTLGRLNTVGPIGCGQLAKLANQTIVGITIGAVAEALRLVQAGGGDVVTTHQALLGGFADSAVLRQHGQRMITADFVPGAHCSTQLKDLATSQALARDLAIDLPILQLVTSLYRQACDNGLGQLDHSAIWLTMEGKSDVPKM